MPKKWFNLFDKGTGVKPKNKMQTVKSAKKNVIGRHQKISDTLKKMTR